MGGALPPEAEGPAEVLRSTSELEAHAGDCYSLEFHPGNVRGRPLLATDCFSCLPQTGFARVATPVIYTCEVFD